MEARKSTVLLTVVAVATLLVAVVGSTFAFFAIQANTEDAKVEVTTTTAAGSDVFNATGGTQLTLDINNENMANTVDRVGTVADTDNTEDNPIVVSLKAGSGTATCTYDLIWENTAAEGFNTYAKTTVENVPVEDLEYTVQGSNGTNEIKEINIDAIADGVLANDITISNVYDDGAATTQSWNFTVNFYNLNVDQGKQMGQKFGGTVKVSDVKCSNVAN